MSAASFSATPFPVDPALQTAAAVYLGSLSIRNFKRIEAVSLTLDSNGQLICISGPNTSGKTSLLDGIELLLCGEKSAPPRPIRDGSDFAEIVGKLVSIDGPSNMTIRRRWTPKGATLEIRDQSGNKIDRTPQAKLDALVGKIAFDPLAFVRDEKAQAPTLRKMTGLDTTDLDIERRRIYDERTAQNKVVATVEHEVNRLPYHPDAPAAPVSMDELVFRGREARDQQQQIDRAATARNSAALVPAACVQTIGRLNQQMEGIHRQIAMLQQQVEGLKGQIVTAEQEKVAAEAKVVQMDEGIARLPVPDQDAIDAALANAGDVNRRVAENRARVEAAERLEAEKAESKRLTDRIVEIDAEKAARLAATTMPIAGLGFGEDGEVTFRGVPLSQASGAEKVKVGLAIGAALNPRLRLILVRDGSLIDAEGMRVLARWAAEQGMLVLVERVADEGEEGEGVVIFEGRGNYDAPTATN